MTEQRPTISVVIIFLNPSGRYLAEAIESVRAQTLEDWELLLVDDGSTDDSTEVARNHSDAEPARIRYLEHPGHANHGMSASRNLGVEAARGRYLAFLDADDTYLPERLAAHVAILETHTETAMVYGPTLYWHSWRASARNVDSVGPLDLATDRPHPPPSILRGFLETRGHILPGICSLTIRREVALAVGGFEAAFRGCYEDQVFLSKICAHHTVRVTDRCLDRYRQHESSCTARAQETGEYRPDLPHPAREHYLRWLAAYLEECGLLDADMRRVLARELWPYDNPLLHRMTLLPLMRAKFALKRWKRILLRQPPHAPVLLTPAPDPKAGETRLRRG